MEFNIETIPEGEIKISNICFKTCPCLHDVTVGNVVYKFVNARKIIAALKARNLDIPKHFDYLLK